MHDFSAPIGWQLPPARKSVSQMIANKDVEGLTGLIQEEMDQYSPPGIHHRMEALLVDNLINDAEFEQLLSLKDPKNLERMLNRLEEKEREHLREKNKQKATYEDIENEFPQELASMPFNAREGLERLMNVGGIDPEDVREALQDGKVDEISEEVIEREQLGLNYKNLQEERSRSSSRSR